MKKLLALAFLAFAVLGALGQSAIQRNVVTTNAIPAGANGQVLVLLSGVPRWSTNAGSLTLTNVTVYGTLTVNTTIVINATGAGNLQLFATNGVQSITLSAPDAFSPSYTLYLPTTVLTNAVLQSTGDGHLYWVQDPTVNSLEVNGSGAGYLLIGDASTTNLFKLIGPTAFGSSFTNFLPQNPGTLGQVLTMGTNGQWYFSTPSASGGDQVFTNLGGTIYPLAAADHVTLLNTNAGTQVTLLFDSNQSLVDTRTTNAQGGIYSFQNHTVLFFQDINAPFTLWSLADPGLDYGREPYYWNTVSNVAAATHTTWANTNGEIAKLNGDGSVSLQAQTNRLGMAGGFATMDGVAMLTRVEPVASITWAATTTLDVHATNANYRTMTLAGDTVFSSTNRAAGHWVTAFITGAATNCAVSWPSWHWMNQAAPTTLAAGKVASLTVFFTGSTDAGAIANYAVEP